MMQELASAVDTIVEQQIASGKPLAIILAGHNGSGKSTMWYEHLADKLQIPLINADRMMLSILPEKKPLPVWASHLRDKNEDWMGVAQKGVQSFVAQAIVQQVPFATETVFSYWKQLEDGSYASKIDMVRDLQAAGYFVLLFFVGLGHVGLSMARVATRKANGGHDVDRKKLEWRFPRTQQAIAAALPVVDAAILADNSRDERHAFTVVRVQMGHSVMFDLRNDHPPPKVIGAWMDSVCGPFPSV